MNRWAYNAQNLFKLILFTALVAFRFSANAQQPANRLNYLDGGDPFYVGLNFPKLTTPQWVGEDGVDAVVTLGIDDMRDLSRYETFCRPILERLKEIDGRAPLSIFSNAITPTEPHLQKWLKEGVTLEVHTLNHPCPILGKRNFIPAKNTYHGSVDLLNNVENNMPVAFRTPCCDSQNTPSPRVFSELLMQNNSAGQFLEMDTSVFNIFTSEDKSLPRSLTIDNDGKSKFEKYVPFDSYVVTIKNYPYPYPVGNKIWEMPCMVPSDWEAQHLHGNSNPVTVEDWKAAIDATVIKQGVFNFVFHPHGWVSNSQMIDWIDHITKSHGKKVKFLNFKEARERLTKNLLGGQPLKNINGQDNGVRLLDLDNDGFMDVVIGNEHVQQTRLWNPKTQQWDISHFPIRIVQNDLKGNSKETGAKFGILQPNGYASVFISNKSIKGIWHFNGNTWTQNNTNIRGLKLNKQMIQTSVNGQDNGIRLRDTNNDGICEIIISNFKDQGVFSWNKTQNKWIKLRFNLPKNVSITRKDGRDNGVRFVDINEDNYLDIIHSNEKKYSLHLFVPNPILGWGVGWSREVMSGQRSDAKAIPMIVRGGEHNNNGAWFHSRHLWVQNEDTAHLPNLVDRRSFEELLRGSIPLPKSPKESAKAIQLLPGYKVELMASEPLVLDPVAFEWDKEGRLWVAEMADYPLGLDNKGKAGGRIRILEDQNNDGRYDHSTVFLESLPYPSGVMPWRDGALISAAPDILFAKDKNNDGKADEVSVLFTGFGQGNQQHRMNGFEYGLDNWIYGANGDSGGAITSEKNNIHVNIRGRDFRFRPRTLEFQTQAGQTQFGRRRDDWGNWFGNSNYSLGWHYKYPEQYIRRNDKLVISNNRQQIGNYDRSHIIKFISKPLQRFNLVGAENHITAANSPTPYRDNLFGANSDQLLFVSAPAYNVIRREILKPDGISFLSHRPEQAGSQEFIASKDSWFRPTMLKTGPDGALWIADFYRLVLEHPEWIPDDVEQKLKLRSGSDRGRLYRVYPTKSTPRDIPKLSNKTIPELVAALDSSNGWRRDTAQQILVNQNDQSTVTHLEALLRKTKNPKALLHALYTLDGINKIRSNHLIIGLTNSHPGVREHAIRLSENLFKKNEADSIEESLNQLVEDSNLRVRTQMAFSLGEWKSPTAGNLLAKLARDCSEFPDLQIAIASSAKGHSVKILKGILNQSINNSFSILINNLLVLASDEASEKELKQLLNKIISHSKQITSWQVIAISDLIENSKEIDISNLDLVIDEEFINSLEAITNNIDLKSENRAAALRLMTNLIKNPKILNAILQKQLNPYSPNQLFDFAIKKLGNTAPSIDALLVHWKSYSPKRKNRVLQHILNNEKKTIGLLKAIQNKQLLASDISTAFQQLLKQHTNKTIKEQAKKYFGAQNPKRNQLIIKRLPKVTELKGNSSSGEAIFTLHCAACHKLGNSGNSYGPNLSALGDKTPHSILTAILNPNEAMEDRFNVYSLTTIDNAQYTGMIINESANGITLMDLNGQQSKILRSNIKKLSSLGRSLMPEGFEQVLSDQNLADLLALINISSIPPKTFTGNKPKLLKEAQKGKIILSASTAEIYGDSLMFEEKYKNLGFWRSSNDRAAWTIETKRAGKFDIHLDWALNGPGNNNQMQLSIGQNKIIKKISGTGSWEHYESKNIGTIQLEEGKQRVTIQALEPLKEFLMDLRSLELIRNSNAN